MSNQQSSPNIPVGTVIAGKYRVERIVGHGGMGVVVAARHIDLCETFAIKLMKATELGNPQAVERFLREARAAVKLKTKSQHVVQVHDVGRLESGEPYIVMELLKGEDLGEIAKRRGPLPLDEVCHFIMQACDALVAAHSIGIIHRDLKPGNLFLARGENGKSLIKVLDFGISKHTFSSGDAPDVEMTNTREVLGTPLYMSPEQMRSARVVDARSDIWSLGVILYKLLTGKPPFTATTMPEMYAAVLDPKPTRPPSTYRRDIPKQLDAVVLRCLEKNPLRRYGRVSDLLAALAGFLRTLAAETDEEGEEAQTLLRPVVSPSKPLVDLTGTVPMSQDELREAARAAQRRPREERSTSPKAGSDPRDFLIDPLNDAPSASLEPDVSAEHASLGTMPLMLPVQPMPPMPQSSRQGEFAQQVYQAANAEPFDARMVPSSQPALESARRRPTLTGIGELAPGLSLQPPPVPAAPQLGGMQRRPSFAGEMVSPLAVGVMPPLSSSGGWPASAPALRQPAPSQPMVAFPVEQAMVAVPEARMPLPSLGVAEPIPVAPPTGSGPPGFAPLPPNEATGPSMAPWAGTHARGPVNTGMRRRRILVGAGLSACVVLALLVTVMRWRTAVREPGVPPGVVAEGSALPSAVSPLPSPPLPLPPVIASQEGPMAEPAPLASAAAPPPPVVSSTRKGLAAGAPPSKSWDALSSEQLRPTKSPSRTDLEKAFPRTKKTKR